MNLREFADKIGEETSRKFFANDVPTETITLTQKRLALIISTSLETGIKIAEGILDEEVVQ